MIVVAVDDIEEGLRKYNATMQNILIVMIKILRIGISIIIKKTWPNIVNIFDAKRAKKICSSTLRIICAIQHRQCLFCRLNAIYPVRLSALYINTKSKSSPPQCVIPARRTLLCQALVQLAFPTSVCKKYLSKLQTVFVPHSKMQDIKQSLFCTAMCAPCKPLLRSPTALP